MIFMSLQEKTLRHVWHKNNMSLKCDQEEADTSIVLHGASCNERRDKDSISLYC